MIKAMISRVVHDRHIKIFAQADTFTFLMPIKLFIFCAAKNVEQIPHPIFTDLNSKWPQAKHVKPHSPFTIHQCTPI